MKILILGATGLIGSAVVQKLLADGHDVAGVARAPDRARRTMPTARWIRADIAKLAPHDWRSLIDDRDAVVNCAGALQDGWSDNLLATQQKAMISLYDAATAAGGRLIIQISARTDGAAACLPFLATKREADAALSASGLPHIILRPALVVGRNAHGGTALIRALASLPGFVPLIHAENPVQTVALDDVADAVAHAIDGTIPPGSDIDLAAEESISLAGLVQLHRAWLGLAPAREIALPAMLAKPVTLVADMAGRLGWRSPLRSTAMTVMTEGVVSTKSGPTPMVLSDAAAVLARNPSGVQDLWFARLYLLKPLTILTLSIFWLLSGLIPLADIGGAAARFHPFMPEPAAITVTVATCLLDVLLGFTILFRPTAQKALFGMILVSLAYLAGGTFLEPQLWGDPLGPLVKVLPSLALTLTALATLDER
jgi:uncharacterized protein YbjT (DUF2867 family)